MTSLDLNNWAQVFSLKTTYLMCGYFHGATIKYIVSADWADISLVYIIQKFIKLLTNRPNSKINFLMRFLSIQMIYIYAPL